MNSTHTSSDITKFLHIALCFWIMKICATTFGETAGYLLSIAINMGYFIAFAAL